MQEELGLKARASFEIPLQVMENEREEKIKREMKRKELEMFNKVINAKWEKAARKAKQKSDEYCQADPYMDNTGLDKNNDQKSYTKALQEPLETDTAMEASDAKIEGNIDLEVSKEVGKMDDTTAAPEVPTVAVETSDAKMEGTIDLEESKEVGKMDDTTAVAKVPEVPKTDDLEDKKDAEDKNAPRQLKRKAGEKPTQPKKKPAPLKKAAQPKKKPAPPQKKPAQPKKTTGEETEKSDEDVILYMCMHRHVNAGSQMTPSGIDAAWFEPPRREE